MFAAAYAPKETVELAGELLDYEVVVRFMNAELYYAACEWAGSGATGQAVLTEYQRLHERRYKQPFAMPRR
jgi:hypothetical protein